MHTASSARLRAPKRCSDIINRDVVLPPILVIGASGHLLHEVVEPSERVVQARFCGWRLRAYYDLGAWLGLSQLFALLRHAWKWFACALWLSW